MCLSLQFQVEQNPNETQKKYYLHTFDATVDTKALPFSYSHSKEAPSTDPDHQRACDVNTCNVTDSPSFRLPCFHTIHTSCFERAGKECPMCTKNLQVRIKNLANGFNESLLKPTNKTQRGNQDNSDDDDDEDGDDSVDDLISINQSRDPSYYSSHLWESHIDRELDSFVVPQPSNHQRSQASHQPAALNIQIAKLSIGNSRFCILPAQVSQATLLGRNGSNACTFIALLLAKMYTTAQQYALLQFDGNAGLNQSWLTLLLSAIVRGNQLYDAVTQGLGNPFFSVAAAKSHLTAVLAPVTLEETLDITFTSENPQVPQSSLAFYLQRLVHERNLAALVIIDGKTVCFVGQNNKVYILDSHPHVENGSVFGALVGMTPVNHLEEFLLNVKPKISPIFNSEIA